MPPGEVASDAPTDIELARSAEATKAAGRHRARCRTRSPGWATGPAGTAVETPPAAPAPVEPAPPEPAPPEPVTYRGRLGKARGLLSGYLGAVRSKGKIDAGTWDDLEEALIRADVGVGATDLLLDDLRTRVKNGDIAGPDALVDALKGIWWPCSRPPMPRWPCPGPAGEPIAADPPMEGRRTASGTGRCVAVRGGQRGGQDHHGGQGGQSDVPVRDQGSAGRRGHLPGRRR